MSTPEILYPFPSAAPRLRPYVVIVEQPSKSLRYRYLCEGRPGTIAGASSTPANKTPFAIQIVGYHGKVKVIVSCVTKDQPYKPHPHNLVGLHCKKGVCCFESDVTPENSIIAFPKMAVQCVKRNDVLENLTLREEKNVDPFMTGFGHRDNVRSIDLNVVRLCFQVFLKCDNKSQKVLTPVVTDPIYNRKTLPDPLIYRLSHCNSYVSGREDDIILLCTRVTRDDVKIRFFEMEYGQIIWEDFGTFHLNHIYNNTAICFKPPKYRDQTITKPVKVLVQLVRPSDNFVSPPIDFEYLPLEAVPGFLKEKRKNSPSNSPLFEQLLQVRKKSHFQFEIPTIEASNNFLMDTVPWGVPQPEELLPDLPVVINEINESEPCSSRRTSGQETASWNITPDDTRSSTHDDVNWNITSEDFSIGTNINFENPNDIQQVLNNFDYNQFELEPIHISSGDLDMTDMDRLSGSLQENLVM